MQHDNLSQRKQIVNNAKSREGAQVVRDLVDFYKTPLSRAITLLNKRFRMTYQELADEVFEGEVSRQAVQKNYTIKEITR